MWTLIIAVLVVAVSLLLGYSKWRHSYWSSRGVDSPRPYPVMGSFIRFIMGDRLPFIEEVQKKFKHQKIFGIYEGFNPAIGITDPELIRHILVKDFDHFENRRHFELEGKAKWVNEMLTNVTGKEWKRLRSTMSPTFSTGKMKNLFDVVGTQAKNLLDYCKSFSESGKTIDMKDAYGRFTIDVIAASAFGIESRALKEPKAIFKEKAEQIFAPSFKAIISMLLFFILPNFVLKLTGDYFIPDVWEFFKKVTQETMAHRRKTGEKRGDFLDLLLEEQAKQKITFDSQKQYKLEDDTIHAESALFLVAGYDTTANALCFTTHFLAKNQDAQEKLREELREIVKDGEVNYHELMEAKYLEACLSEALRIAPPAPMLERKCTKDYVIPNTNIEIKKDMMVEVLVWGLHHDPEYWPEPYEYKPERFLPENKASQTPFTYMPFGLGPRNCIAMRFALMEAKIALTELILNYNFKLAPGHEELCFENGGGIVRPGKSGVGMIITKVE